MTFDNTARQYRSMTSSEIVRHSEPLSHSIELPCFYDGGRETILSNAELRRNSNRNWDLCAQLRLAAQRPGC
jgi:hypothetical protein